MHACYACMYVMYVMYAMYARMLCMHAMYVCSAKKPAITPKEPPKTIEWGARSAPQPRWRRGLCGFGWFFGSNRGLPRTVYIRGMHAYIACMHA